MQSEQPAATPRPRAVVVEADPLLAALIDDILQLAGFDAPDHLDVAAVTGSPPDGNVAVIDLDTLAEDQELAVSLPVILLTSAFSPPRQYLFRHVVVVKPFRVQEFRDALRELLADSS